MKLLGYLSRVLRAEGFLRGMARIASRVSMKPKSLFFSRLFDATGTIVAGAPAEIIKVFDEATKKWLRWQHESEQVEK